MKRGKLYQNANDKKWIPGVLICLYLMFSGCSDIFKSENFSLSDIQTYEQLEQAMGGVIDYYKDYVKDHSSIMCNIFGDDLLVYEQLTRDSYSGGTTNYYGTYRGFYQCTGSHENFKFEICDWEVFYKLIASVNNVLSQFDLSEKYDDETMEILGEFYFYRAFFHFRLTRIYGRIPTIDNIDVNYTVKRPSYSEIYEFIEADMLEAIRLLPANIEQSRIPYETPNRGSAKALLGEIYLNWAGFPAKDESKYALAAQITGDVIDSAAFYGFELLPDFEDLWNEKSYYNNEAVLCNYFKHGKFISYIYRGTYYVITPDLEWIPEFGVDSLSQMSVTEDVMPEIEFYNKFPKGYRKDITFFTRIYVRPNTYYPDIEAGYIYVDTVNCASRPAYRKFYLDTVCNYSSHQWGDFDTYSVTGCQRIYTLRFAQTLLTYAEASARSGKLDEKAYECLNIVRRRANNLPLDVASSADIVQGLSLNAFADSVVQERAWELAGEHGQRWADMVRTQTVEKVYEQKDHYDCWPFVASENDQYFFPIPDDDINLNPNLDE